MKLVDKIRSSHPHLEKRIARLENWQDIQDEESFDIQGEYEEEAEIHNLDDEADTDTNTANNKDTLPFVSSIDDVPAKYKLKDEVKNIDDIVDDILTILRVKHLEKEEQSEQDEEND